MIIVKIFTVKKKMI